MTNPLQNIRNMDIQSVLDCIYDRISIINKDGRLIWANKAFDKYNFSRDQLIGKHMSELIRIGVNEHSLVLDCLEQNNKDGLGMVHHNKSGVSLDWALPHLDENGEIDFVVSTEWDIEHLTNMWHFFEEALPLTDDEFNELNYYRSLNKQEPTIICNSGKMQHILAIATNAARSDASILIQGESGTGKEVLMKHIYSKSFRCNAPLVEVNCGAIPEHLVESELFGYKSGAFTGASPKGKRGLFELANNGTIFLDEISELPYNVQSKLLRVLQEQKILRVGDTVPIPIDVRVIAATNVNLEEAIKEKTFRSDLFYRLNVIPIKLPPLRERKEDIGDLINYYLSYYRQKHKKRFFFSQEAQHMLYEYDWPGNIRELKNLIERLYIIETQEKITAEILRSYLNLSFPCVVASKKEPEMENTALTLKEKIEDYEKRLLLEHINDFHSLRRYADFLGMPKSTLARKLEKYGVTNLSDPD